MGLEQFAYLTFGWLLGLLAPAIQERIRRRYRVSELMAGIRAELHELQYTMALVSHKLSTHVGTANDEHLAWLEKIAHDYKGPNPTSGILAAVLAHRKIPEEQRLQALTLIRSQDGAVGLMQYSIPFVNAHLGDISLFPVAFQTAVFRVKSQLDIFNQRVLIQQKYLDKTFDTVLAGPNHDAIVSGLQEGYTDLADQSKRIADGISTLPPPGRLWPASLVALILRPLETDQLDRRP